MFRRCQQLRADLTRGRANEQLPPELDALAERERRTPVKDGGGRIRRLLESHFGLARQCHVARRGHRTVSLAEIERSDHESCTCFEVTELEGTRGKLFERGRGQEIVARLGHEDEGLAEELTRCEGLPALATNPAQRVQAETLAGHVPQPLRDLVRRCDQGKRLLRVDLSLSDEAQVVAGARDLDLIFELSCQLERRRQVALGERVISGICCQGSGVFQHQQSPGWIVALVEELQRGTGKRYGGAEVPSLLRQRRCPVQCLDLQPRGCIFSLVESHREEAVPLAELSALFPGVFLLSVANRRVSS